MSDQLMHDLTTDEGALASRCELFRSLHVPGDPVVLPNAWDVASARAVVAAGFPVVATTSGGVAGSLGYEDHEGAPGDEMLAAAARIARGVDVPVTVDAEAGYGIEPGDLVAALKRIGAAGCNLEDTNYATEGLVEPAVHATWLRDVRDAAEGEGYGLVINARIDVFLAARGGDQPQIELVSEALERADAYRDAGVDCVYPIALREEDALEAFVPQVGAPVNILPIPQGPSVPKLAEIGVARISYGSLLFWQAMGQFEGSLRELLPPTP